jgi:hypothetical protein
MSGFFVTKDEHWLNVDKIVLMFSCLEGIGRVILEGSEESVRLSVEDWKKLRDVLHARRLS